MSGIAQDKRNALAKAIWLLRAKNRSRGLAYSCLLGEQPSDLVPHQARAVLDTAATADELVVNPSFQYQVGPEPPRAVRDRGPLLDGFERGSPMAWVLDPGTDVWTAYWAPHEWADALASLRAGLPVPAGLPPAIRRTLAMAGVLVAPGFEPAQRAHWQAILESAAAEYDARGYTVLRGLLPPLQLGAMRRHYRALVGGGTLQVGDNQVAERHRLHSELVASFFHPQLASVVGRVVGEPVVPSYVYFASYKPGADLPRHVDRPQCEFSISLLVDYTPEPEGPSGWPLCMEDPRTGALVGIADLGIGDAVVYRGRELVHYRDPLPDGHQSTSIFFHYVRPDFEGDLV
jgi:hypothetical protein